MDTQPGPKDAAIRAVMILDGVVAAARLLGVPGHRHQTVQSWLKTRVPAEYCPLIERETRARGAAVLCEELRPDIEWAVLRHTGTSSTGAPTEGQMSREAT